MNDYKIYKHENRDGFKLAVIHVDWRNPDPSRTMDLAIENYVGDDGYNHFIDVHLDNPYYAIITKNIDKIIFNGDLEGRELNLEQLKEDLHRIVDEFFSEKNYKEGKLEDYLDMYHSWDKGDCSSVGLARILMIATLKEYLLRPYGDEPEFEKILEVLETKYHR